MSKLSADLCLVVTEKTRIALEKKVNEIKENIQLAKVEKETAEEALLMAVKPHTEMFAAKVNAKLEGLIDKDLVIKEDGYRGSSISFHDGNAYVQLGCGDSESYVALKVRFPIGTLPRPIREMIKDTKGITDKTTKLEAVLYKIKTEIYDNKLPKTVRLMLAEARLAKEAVDVDAMVAKMLSAIFGQ